MRTNLVKIMIDPQDLKAYHFQQAELSGFVVDVISNILKKFGIFT
jgi:hypothetical protein